MECTIMSREFFVFRNHYVKLVSTLAQHLSNVLLYLVSEGVIKIEEKNTIKDYRDTPNDRAEYLLDNHVNRQLSEGITDNFLKLLKVMRKIPGCNPLAVELSKALDTDTSCTPVVSNARLIISENESKNIQTGTKAIDLEEYRKRFSEDDVENSFVYMLSRLEELWENVKFSKLKSSCKRDGRLPDELKRNLSSALNLEEIFDFLSNSEFCTWLEIRTLKCMAKVADIPEAISMLEIFEECVYSRKCSEVKNYFRDKYINPSRLTVMVSKLNKDAENLVVADLIKYCRSQETILRLPPDSVVPVGSNIGCLEIRMVIPCCHCTYVYEVAKSHFFKLRTLNTRYLQIGNFPKVYTTDLTNTTEANSLLTEISSHENWSHPLQVINHYYTYLEGHMDADSVSHMMHSEHLITDSDYEAITAAPNDINMNRLLLQYVRAMDMTDLLKFCNLLKNIDTHHCIGDNLETSLESTKFYEIAEFQSEYVISAPSKLMTCQFKDVNTIFLEVIEGLVAHIHTVDIEFLANKCCTLMASNIHSIKLFTDSFVKKLFKCSNLNLLKLYLLPFNTWFDNTILRELATSYENTDLLKQFCKYVSVIDETQLIMSYPIPTYSQLIIPLDDSEYTIVAIKTFRNCSELVLRDVKDIKELLISYWELTAHAIYLAAIDYPHNLIYWMIPKQVKQLVVDKLNKGFYELWQRGIFMAMLLPKDFFAAQNYFDNQEINIPFNVSKHLLTNSMEVCQLNFDGMKSCDILLEKENSELKSQLGDIKEHHNKLHRDYHELRVQFKVKEKQLENLEFDSEKVQHANKFHEENFKLKAQLKSLQKTISDLDNMKEHANILQNENSELKSQLVELEKKQYINQFGELKDEERCSITDMANTNASMLSEQPPRALHKDDDEYIYATTSCNSNEYTYEGFYAETSVENLATGYMSLSDANRESSDGTHYTRTIKQQMSPQIHKDTLCKRLEEEKDDLISKISILERNYKSLQEKHQKLIDKYTQLKSQMSSNTTAVMDESFMMDVGVRQVLQASQEEAVICIHLSYLLPELRKRKLVTDLEFRQYSDEKRTADERNKALLRLIETKGGEKSFDLFVQALEAEKQHTGHEYLARKLREGKSALKRRLVFQSAGVPIPPPKPLKKDLIEIRAGGLSSEYSMLTDYMRQVNSLSAILTKDVSEIKRMVSSSYTSLELKLSMAVMAVEGLQTKVDALNVLAESHRNDGYDYKKSIPVTYELIPEPVNVTSESTHGYEVPKFSTDYVKDTEYTIVGSQPKESILESAYDYVRPNIGNYSEEAPYTTVSLEPSCAQPNYAHPKITSDQHHEQQYEKPIPQQKAKLTQDEYAELSLITKGNSGEFWLAISKSDCTKVVIKKPADSKLQVLGEEVNVLTLCQHPNIVKLISPILSEQVPSLVFEYAEKGQLREYLLSEKDNLHESKLIAMATNIACGMVELESHGFVHCNLKASNILVDKDLVCKLASFHNVLCLKHNEKYRICTSHRMAIRWQAPEVLNGYRFSIKSDVWSFGVLLSELFTYGDKPYPDMKPDQVKMFVLNKNKMSQPSGCPKEVYKLMKECFDTNVDKRPSFKALHVHLKKLQSKLFRTSSNSFEEYTA